MTDKQPEALRLAEHDERLSRIMRMEPTYAPELRRLHEVNAELVEALKAFDDAAKDSKSIIGFSGKALPLLKKARAAIAKATGEQQ
jgi:DNA repair ATPase RecN